jgi:beta-xylosidase
LSWNPSIHCIGSATSVSVQGPYDPSQKILACHEIEGGAIDPSGFYDSSTGRRFITYKVDGNALGNGGNCNNEYPPVRQTPIMLLEVSSDGSLPQGAPSMILDREDPDGPLVEAPSLTNINGKYFLFFSSNCFDRPLYDTSFAVSESISGPFTKRGPLLVTGDLGLSAPGGAAVTPDGGFMAFHAGPIGFRYMYTARIEQQGNTQITICTSAGCKTAS